MLPLDLRPSWRFALLIAGLHGLAAASLAIAFPGLVGAALAVLLAALGGAAAWDRALLRGRRSPRSLRLSSEGNLHIELADGTSYPVAAGARTVNRFLVALPLEGLARRSILVTADMLDPGRFRLLRLWALWGRLPGVASAPLRG